MSAPEPLSKTRVILIPLDLPETSRNVNNSKTGEQMTMFTQQCDLHLPYARHPLEYKHTYFNPSDRMLQGKQYTLGEGAYQLDQYGNLTLNRYAPWVEVKASSATKAA